MNANTNSSVKFLQAKFKNTSRRWYAMAKWASFQGWRVSSKSENQLAFSHTLIQLIEKGTSTKRNFMKTVLKTRTRRNIPQ